MDSSDEGNGIEKVDLIKPENVSTSPIESSTRARRTFSSASLMPVYTRPRDAVPIKLPTSSARPKTGSGFAPMDTLNAPAKISHQMKRNEKPKPGRPGVKIIEGSKEATDIERMASEYSNKRRKLSDTSDTVNESDAPPINLEPCRKGGTSEMVASYTTEINSAGEGSYRVHTQNSRTSCIEHRLGIAHAQFGTRSIEASANGTLSVVVLPLRQDSYLEIRSPRSQSDDSLSSRQVLKLESGKVLKVIYCLDSLQIVIKMKNRLTLYEVTADYIVVDMMSKDDSALIKFMYDVDGISKIEALNRTQIQRLINAYSGNKKKPSAVIDKVATVPERDGSPSTSGRQTRSSQRVVIDDDRVSQSAEYVDESDDKILGASVESSKATKFGRPLRFKFGSKTVEVTAEDFARLEEGEFLNDTLIDFYLTYTLSNLPPSISEKTYIFNTFFYKRLTQRVNGVKGSFENVKKWTSKVDLFGMKYLVIPIHESSHWFVAVICNVGNIGTVLNTEAKRQEGDSAGSQLRSSSPEMPDVFEFLEAHSEDPSRKQTVSGEEPTIFVFDSLNLRHNSIFKPLKDYLAAASLEKRGMEADSKEIKGRYGQVPVQPNYCDCGVYLLHFVETFLQKADAIIPLLTDTKHNKKLVNQQLMKMWGQEQLSVKRQHIKDVILKLKANSETEQPSEPGTPSPTDATGEARLVLDLEQINS
ncbi:uncharacterized protein V1510DRAFT_287784 [Dipodascopsis tothii]|uniref:uncharacterized protein n=1 Tax=Dipodascopsis tothii TaxID=44089 RepID=UPI0034CEBFF3